MKKVSILTPCYNVGKFLPIYFDSIISQKYEPLELILVDDGSTDNTASVIDEYRTVLEENNIELKYIYKENGGQASAVDLGIKEVTGEYLIWPDSDDFLLENSIIKRVEYMEAHPECAIVRSNGYVYHENDLTKPTGKISKLNRETRLNDFVSFMVPWCPGCYMVRMSYFDLANPERRIVHSRCGQNIQMLLPVVYYYPCHYLNEYLFGYVIHSKSHSHSISSYERSKEHLDNLQNCVSDTLDIIREDTSQALKSSQSFFRYIRYSTAWQNREKSEMLEYEKALRANKEFNFEAFIMKHMNVSKISKFILRIISKIKRSIKHD